MGTHHTLFRRVLPTLSDLDECAIEERRFPSVSLNDTRPFHAAHHLIFCFLSAPIAQDAFVRRDDRFSCSSEPAELHFRFNLDSSRPPSHRSQPIPLDMAGQCKGRAMVQMANVLYWLINGH